MKSCPDGYPGCRVAEATGKWCAGQCEAMTEPCPSPEQQAKQPPQERAPNRFKSLMLPVQRG